MDYKEQEPQFDLQNQDYSNYESAELERMFENAETDSETYNAIIEELSKRGYNFSAEEDFSQEEQPEPLAQPIKALRYSIAGTRIWNIVALILGILGAGFFLSTQASLTKTEPSLRIMVYAMVVLLVTLSYIITGIRLLANLKDQSNPRRIVLNYEYWFLAIVWYLFCAYELYNAAKGFYMYWKMSLGIQISLFAIIPTLAMALFSFLLGMAMFYLAKELKVHQGFKVDSEPDKDM
ncbi:MAG: hypothetical protein PHY41_03520 [Candidatus Cloacimonetes bacterium]|jgi:cation transport ATPase|nr:hypothetical protein [Candidatus Cloacimonadota bacterium]MDY0299337.1 hypothetical protein [Candidatus Cloacimonadaceae bacterium]MCB5278142.1 hypothetical protein [Candidatus Cloacimonadota bacterium]MCK9332876.1 hypothetical protein [Candidatus Cloacimonadota bacterium]MDD2211284.1 hypothetical protein [Candidatus Cloacimonadota bacterium]